jgi:hypothetical protein
MACIKPFTVPCGVRLPSESGSDTLAGSSVLAFGAVSSCASALYEKSNSNTKTAEVIIFVAENRINGIIRITLTVH